MAVSDTPVPLEPGSGNVGVPSVVVDSADIRYHVYEERQLTMKQMVARGFRRRESAEVHAVDNVSFTVSTGEAVGIVGSNGSGKSTLLRAIAGIQTLESGSIRVRGEARLLSVGAALQPALSGRRNVMLGGLAMGMTRTEIEQRMDDIIEFSGLGQAMNRPMKTYSSGMRARLAFSIATAKVPDILLIDEALAVGDRRFRKRSLDRINEIREQAGTVLMVTHNSREIRASCTRAIWLERGTIRADGDVGSVLDAYEERPD